MILETKMIHEQYSFSDLHFTSEAIADALEKIAHDVRRGKVLVSRVDSSLSRVYNERRDAYSQLYERLQGETTQVTLEFVTLDGESPVAHIARAVEKR